MAAWEGTLWLWRTGLIWFLRAFYTILINLDLALSESEKTLYAEEIHLHECFLLSDCSLCSPRLVLQAALALTCISPVHCSGLLSVSATLYPFSLNFIFLAVLRVEPGSSHTELWLLPIFNYFVLRQGPFKSLSCIDLTWTSGPLASGFQITEIISMHYHTWLTHNF